MVIIPKMSKLKILHRNFRLSKKEVLQETACPKDRLGISWLRPLFWVLPRKNHHLVPGDYSPLGGTAVLSWCGSMDNYRHRHTVWDLPSHPHVSHLDTAYSWYREITISQYSQYILILKIHISQDSQYTQNHKICISQDSQYTLYCKMYTSQDKFILIKGLTSFNGCHNLYMP